jgi:hypothetical protein
MQNMRFHEGKSSPNPAADLLRALSSRRNEGSFERTVTLLPGVKVVAVSAADMDSHQSSDVVNAFLKPAFQSPYTSPTTDTPSTLPPPHRLFAAPADVYGISPGQFAGFQSPRRDVAVQVTPSELICNFAEEVGPAAMCNSSHSNVGEPSSSIVNSEDFPLPLHSHDFEHTSPPPFHCDGPIEPEDQEVQELARSESPLQEVSVRQEHSSLLHTPARDPLEPLRPTHSPIGKMPQYSPKTVRLSTTPTPARDRGACVPCQCPKPPPEVSLATYRQKFPYGKYKVKNPLNDLVENVNPGNGSVNNECLFFKNAIHNGLPLEFVVLSLELESNQDRKQRVENHRTIKEFIGGEKKKGGIPKASSKNISIELVDVQLASSHHP